MSRERRSPSPDGEERQGQVRRQLAVRVQPHEVGVPQPRAGKLGQRGGQRGGEQQRLAGGPQLGQDGPDLLREAHLEQPVGLVEHAVLHRPQAHALDLLEVVHQAACKFGLAAVSE